MENQIKQTTGKNERILPTSRTKFFDNMWPGPVIQYLNLNCDIDLAFPIKRKKILALESFKNDMLKDFRVIYG